ncbi:MAG: FHA domain-containing protein [Candidatus Promineofilum sp.]|nr:FHA domain-containing protein [Promineifilum sp.]
MRLHIARRLITVLLSALLLFVAAPLFAQDTPAPTVDNPAIHFDSDRAESLLGQPGVVRLVVNFTTLELPEAPGYTTFALRTTDADVYRVIASRIDNQPAAVTPAADSLGYAWPLPTATGPHVLVADLQMLKPVGPTSIALVVPNSDGTPAALAYLSEATIAELAAAQQQAATPAPATAPPVGTATAPAGAGTTAAPPPATNTKPPPATLPATITADAPATPTADEPVVPLATAPATPTAPDGGNSLVPLLLGGLFLLAALAVGGLLLLRRRRAPAVPLAHAPATARAVTVPLPPVGAETVTGVLIPVYLELEGDAPQVFPVNETPFTIGRDPGNSLPIDETIPGWQTVSREHALISRHDRGYVIEDLGSQNGVRVNGRLTPKNLLRNGWQVTVGSVSFRFVDETQTN